jgi:hypothetical protein
METRDTYNTSYKVHVGRATDQEIQSVNIEQGAMMVSDSGLYMGYNGENVRIYPQSATASNKGWVRYDDTQYTSLNKLSLVDEVVVDLPNNGGSVYRSAPGIDYYDQITNRLIADNLNDTYLLTVSFVASAANTNSTHLDFSLTDGSYTRVSKSISFYKANDTPENFHNLFQYYVDADFIANGSGIKINSHGGTAKIWDVIFFIQKTQSYA